MRIFLHLFGCKHNSPETQTPPWTTLQHCQAGIFQNKPHLRGQCVVHQDVGPCGVGPEGPDGPGGQQIPVVFRLEEFSQLLPAEGEQEKTV